MCGKLHVLSSSGRGVLNESCYNNVDPYKPSILSLDYVLWTLKPGGDWLVPKGDVCNSELAVFIKEDLRF